MSEMPFSKVSHIKVIECIAEGMSKAGNLNTYLEIGIAKGECFNRVAPFVKGKAYAVDINDKCKPYIKGNPNLVCCICKSDDFFNISSIKIMFDLIFIDGEHIYPQVESDFINSWIRLNDNGIICIHDTYPPNKEYLQHCKDSYKIAERLRIDYGYEKNNMEWITLPFYYGITIIRKIGKNPWE